VSSRRSASPFTTSIGRTITIIGRIFLNTKKVRRLGSMVELREVVVKREER